MIVNFLFYRGCKETEGRHRWWNRGCKEEETKGKGCKRWVIMLCFFRDWWEHLICHVAEYIQYNNTFLFTYDHHWLVTTSILQRLQRRRNKRKRLQKVGNYVLFNLNNIVLLLFWIMWQTRIYKLHFMRHHFI